MSGITAIKWKELFTRFAAMPPSKPTKSAFFFSLNWWLSTNPKVLFGASWTFTEEQIRAADKGDGVIGDCQGIKCVVTRPIPITK